MTKAGSEEDRCTGIGASDAAALMNEPPGCRRRLWYEKCRVLRDVPEVGLEKIFRRGKRLEPLVISEYRMKTKRLVWMERKGQRKRVDEEVPYFYHHRDGLIPKRLYGGTPGLLECKTKNFFAWRKMQREGMGNDHILQIQWGMRIDRLAWGAFAVLWPDGWELLEWDVMRNPDLSKLLRNTGHEFWRRVQDRKAPDALDHEDPRCKRCGWRYTCRQLPLSEDTYQAAREDALQAEQDESLLELLSDLQDAQAIAQQDNELVENIRQELRSRVGDRELVKCRGFLVYHRKAQSTQRFVVDKLKKDFPKIYELCLFKSEGARQLRVYPNPEAEDTHT